MRLLKKKNPNHIKNSKSDTIFDVFNTIFLCLLFIVLAYPMLITISSSFSSPDALVAGKVRLFPVDFTLVGYKAVLQNESVIRGLFNSIFYTVLGTTINIVTTVLAAYPLSRKDLKVQGIVSLLFAFTMWFGGGMIPAYILVKDLHLYNTRLAMIIPSMFSIWNMVIIRTYFQNSIPESIFESARLDGCDDFRYLLKIAIPISKPVIAVVILYYVVGNWNSFFNALYYLRDADLKPLSLVLREILLMHKEQDLSSLEASVESGKVQLVNEVLKYALVIVSSIPMTVLYLFTQKYFAKGIMVGSVKG